ncbi:NACHT domain-containing protein [Nonomuraea sp. G32]|nr:NACHT domain-containing protein [Nonomuraea sp. G32]MDP4507147.1 NACHT domain-containing protein [Nonomuraea sp. G32]
MLAALMALEQITMDEVQAAHLDAHLLAEQMSAKSKVSVAHCSDAGKELYSLLLAGCCVQLVEFFTRQPEFAARTALEHSRILGELKSRIPAQNQIFGEFELRHREAVVALYDKMNLFGLGLPTEEQTYQLSTAYVNLSLYQADEKHGQDGPPNSDNLFQNRITGHVLEDFLGESHRILIEGPAGAGKSTLLQRLALHICRQEFPPPLSEWNNLVPFPLRLRTLVSDETLRLPSPDEFVKASVWPLSGAAPAGWISSVLANRRAVIMVDGVDEVKEPHREEVMTWLEELSAVYTGNRFLVTTRPAALAEGHRALLRRHGFITTRLEPMTPTQVDLFIDKWHEGVATTSFDLAKLPQRAAALKNALILRRDLANLATNPLLCAMLCALNRNLNSELPRGKVALYRAALSMLLERRDTESRIIAAPVQLTQTQAQALLAHMAMWMTLEGRRTIPKSTALAQIREFLPRLRGDQFPPHVPETADLVLKYLLERSGVLQDPTIDLLEFRHPSFQDYLAGVEAFRKDNLGHLLRNAHDPFYHDVLIMVAGQTQEDEARQTSVLAGLIEQARNAGSRSRQLWLLAAACISDVELVDPDIASTIKENTAILLPPRSASEAESMASAGDFVLDLLAEIVLHSSLTDGEAAATVVTAGLIGGVSGLSLLKTFRNHPSPVVRAELVNLWVRSRSPHEYLEEVLLATNLSDVPVTVHESAFLPLLGRLKTLRDLTLVLEKRDDSNDAASYDCAAFTELHNLQSLSCQNVNLVNTEDLASLSNLVRLDLARTNIDSVLHVTRLRNLTYLNLEGTRITNLKSIATLSNLVELILLDTKVFDIKPLAGLKHLRILDLSGTKVNDIAPLASLRSLRKLNLTGAEVTDLQPLADFSELEIIGWHPPAASTE